MGACKILPGLPASTPWLTWTTLEEYLTGEHARSRCGPDSMNYWGNYPKFMVSLLKAYYGDEATTENDFGYAWLPKSGRGRELLLGLHLRRHVPRDEHGGRLITFGMNPVGHGPNSPR